MKKRIYFSNFLKAALSLVLIQMFSFSVMAQGTVTISKPVNVAYYEYDNAAWVHKHNITNTYNSKGYLLTTLNTTPVTNQNIAKTENILDAFDRTNTTTDYIWQNNAWVTTNIVNNITTYNSANQVTEGIMQRLKNGALTNERKVNLVYDANGNNIERIEYLWQNNAWQDYNKNTFTYVNGVQTEQVASTYDKVNAIWVPFNKIYYTGWHILNQRPIVTVQQMKNAAGVWENRYRHTTSVGTNGSYETVAELYQNNTWVTKTRTNYTYDSHGNYTDNLFEELINGTWRMVFIDKAIYTYSTQNDMLEMISQGQDSAYAPLKNQYKEVYSNFQYFTRSGLGTSETQNSKLALNVYPNPATNKVQIQLGDKKDQVLTAYVQDVTGKTWLTKTFKAAEAKQLNLEALPKGIYLLQLQTETGSIVKRIVKQ